jgi:cell division protein FtsL
MTVIVRKEWLRHYGRGVRLGRARSVINWAVVWRYGWILAIAFIPVFFYIWQNVQIITSGYEIEHLRKKLTDIQSRNSLLTVEAASLEDLSTMEGRALYELGMIRPSPGQIVYVRPGEKARTNADTAESPAPSGR